MLGMSELDRFRAPHVDSETLKKNRLLTQNRRDFEYQINHPLALFGLSRFRYGLVRLADAKAKPG